MNCFPKNPAGRRYFKRFSLNMGAYVVTLLTASWMFKHHAPTGALAYLLALLPGLAIVGVIISVGLYIVEEKDEFQRNILIQSMIWAIGGTLSVTTVWGFLELLVKAPPLQIYLAFPLFWFFVGIATPLLKLRYR